MHKYLSVFILFPVIILAGCGGSAFLSSSDRKEPVEFDTIARGEILAHGQDLEVGVRINAPELVPELVTIEILSGDGESLGLTELPGPSAVEYIPPVELPDGLADGYYLLVVRVYSGGEVSAETRKEFYLASGSYNILGIRNYPPVFSPGGGGLVFADLDYPPDSDCWLRWSLDGKRIASGSVLSGTGSINLTVPDEAGVYSLLLEVFPEPPEAVEGFPFVSPLSRNMAVYVNPEQTALGRELAPRDDFRLLYHFRGNLNNSGTAAGFPVLGTFGSPVLDVRKGIFGYYLESGAGFRLEGNILPEQDGLLDSFSLMFSVVPHELPADYTGPAGIFSFEEDGGLSLDVKVLSDGSLKAGLAFDGVEHVLYSPAGSISPGTYSSPGLAVRTEEGFLEMEWYLNGKPAAVLREDLGGKRGIAYSEDGNGRTVFFGSGNFSVLVDEIGLYCSRNSSAVDPNQFRRAADLKYGKAVLFADGFDSGAVSDGVLFEGAAVMEDSVLALEPGASVLFPEFCPAGQGVVIEFHHPAESSSLSLVLYAGDRVAAEVPVEKEDFNDAGAGFTVYFKDEAFSLADFSGNGLFSGRVAAEDCFRFGLRNTDAELTAVLEDVIIRTASAVSAGGSADTVMQADN